MADTTLMLVVDGRHTASAWLARSILERARMLNDARLKRQYATVSGRALPSTPDGVSSPVQPASIDLSIGNIYLPGIKPHRRGSIQNPKRSHELGAGQTAVITTKEQIKLPSTMGAIGFPPTRISDNGILMTNPGHVDPGFNGKLSFTVINMGREPFDLQRDDRIVTLVFFDVVAPDSDYAKRHPGPASAHDMTQDRLDRLAPDMLNVEQRVTRILRNEENKTRRWGFFVPLALAAVVSAGTYFGPQVADWRHNFDDVTSRLAVLEERVKNQDDLQTQIDQLEQDIKNLELELAEGRANERK